MGFSSFAESPAGLKQSELAGLVGMSTNTLQSVELQRLPLSEKFAFALAEQTGIRAKWLLDNELGDPPPDPAEMRRTFEERQAHPWGSSYLAYLSPRMSLFRFYVLAREVANELGGHSTYHHSGFINALMKLNRELNACLPDNYVRRKVYQKVQAIVKEGDEKVCKLVISDVTEIRRATRENEVEKKVVQKWVAEHLDVAGDTPERAIKSRKEGRSKRDK